MFATTFAAGLVGLATAAIRAQGAALEHRADTPSQGFYSPYAGGGEMLTIIPNLSVGEPLNVIVSGQSDAGVLTPEGFGEYMQSLYFSPGSCLGVSIGDAQAANLGDGKGAVNQTDVLRYNYMQGDGGTCQESLNGGNHLRYWMQNGTSANSGAIFMAVSYEMPAAQNHNIADDGYNFGRDLLVGNATISNGTRSPGGFTYQTTSTSNTDLFSNVTTSMINHGISVDGSVAVLTVKITKEGTIGAGRNSSSSSGSGSSSSSSSSSASAKSVFMPSRFALFGCFLLALFLANGPALSRAEAIDDSVPHPRALNPRSDSSDPGVALGQKLTNQTNPDPVPQNNTDGLIINNQTPTPITDDQKARISYFTKFSAAAYCPQVFENHQWTCGSACDAVPGVEVLAGAGDGDLDPHWQVLWSPDDKAVAVVYEGSNFSKLFSLLDDFVFLPVPVASPIRNKFTAVAKSDDPKNPGPLGQLTDAVTDATAVSATLVHLGFQSTWSRTYNAVLTAAKAALAAHPEAERVYISGHSLGAALATLSMIALRDDLGTSLPFEVIVFGLPRIGNPPFAGLLDQLITDPSQNITFSHVTNYNDVVPHLGPLILGFEHPMNEVWIPYENSPSANNCPGQENTNCALSQSLNLTIDTHAGPYLGTLIGRGSSGNCTVVNSTSAQG